MSTEQLATERSDGTLSPGRARDLQAWVAQLVDDLRSHGAAGQDGDQQAPAQLKSAGEAALAPLRAALAERSASAARGGPSTVECILAWLLYKIEVVVADVVSGVVLLDEVEQGVYAASKAPIHEVNPNPDYWYQRADGPGEHHYSRDGNYLVLTIPPASIKTYWNAEIYNNPRTQRRPKNILINLLTPDDPTTWPELRNYTNDYLINLPYIPANRVVFEGRIRAETMKGGSRGWGFWNLSLFPSTMQVAWFVQYEGVKTRDGDAEPAVPSGFYLQTQNGTQGLDSVFHRLPDLDEDWHDYRIELSEGVVFYFIDGRLVHQVWGPAVPVTPVQFHCWVDNAVFGMSEAGAQHIMQDTKTPRSNIIHSMSIASPGSSTSASGRG